MNALIIAMIIELGAAMFLTCLPGDLSASCPEGRTFLLSWVLNPQNWDASTLLGFLKDNLLEIGGATIAIGAALYLGGIELVVFGGMAAVFLSYTRTLWLLHQTISNIGFFGGVGGMIATTLLGGIFIYTVIAVVDFVRGRD